MARLVYIFLILLIATISVFSLLAFKPSQTGNIILNETYSVQRVIDGDTFVLSSGDHVRLLNMDTPEKGQYYNKEATARMKQLAENKTVILEKDKTNKDKYGRLLRYAYVDGQMLELIMVREGFARSYLIMPDDKYYNKILEAENYAKSLGIGIWQYDNITGAFCVWVYDFHPDAKSYDEQNLNDEYLVLRNSCTNPVNMTGWSIQNKHNQIFKLPDFTIQPKEKVWIRSGSGNDNQTDIYMGISKPFWTNSGDTFIMLNSENQIVINYSYGKS